jgi:gamma-glutamyl hydrolase
MKLYIFLLLLFSLLLLNIENRPIKPIVAIYGNSNPENGDEEFLNGTYYPISYVYWLESFGAEVMAIHYWYSYEEIDEILQKINGILFLGGGRLFLKNATWEKKAKFIIEKSIEYKIPIWGTCLGFELMGIILSDNFTLLKNEFNDVNILHNLQINNNTKRSSMFKLFYPNDYDILEYTNSTIYNHVWGFYPDEFMRDKKLDEITVVTSIAQDKEGNKFINSFEGKNKEFFAVQFHPEKNPFKRINYKLEQNMESLKVSQKLGMNFIQQTRKNKNRFNDEDRIKYDFFNTYNGTKNCIYDKSDETFYFYKK